jgi:nitroreductase
MTDTPLTAAPAGQAHQTLDPGALLAALHWRYATKVFDSEQPISAELWASLEQAMVLSPSSYGLQPWKFLVITDPAIKAELRPHSWNQSQITDCSHLVVFLVRRSIEAADAERLINATAQARGLPLEQLAPYRGMIEKDLIHGPRSQVIGQWCSNQVYIALGNLMTCAALVGADTCPIEGFAPGEYDRILKLGDTPYRSSVVCACGTRSSDDKHAKLAKVRFPLEELVERR